MRTIDAHFHIWRQADLAWLVGHLMGTFVAAVVARQRDGAQAEVASRTWQRRRNGGPPTRGRTPLDHLMQAQAT